MFQGKDSELLANWMPVCASWPPHFEYERAAVLRPDIQPEQDSRKAVCQQQYLTQPMVACVARDGPGVRQSGHGRGGRHLGDKSFFRPTPTNTGPADAVEAFLLQHYLERSIPQQIIVAEIADAVTMQALL